MSFASERYRLAAEQASTVSRALPYLRRYAGATIVVKYGGHAMGDESLAAGFGRDIAALKQVGINPVVVHGGGPQINTMLNRLKIQSTFVDGLRVTDAAMVEVVEMVLAGSVNKHVTSLITQAGALAVGICGKDGGLIRAKKLTRVTRDPDSHIECALDLGFVGEPSHIDIRVIHALTGAGLIPVIAPVGLGEDGETYNINADTAASAIASALQAHRLLMLTDVPGVLDENKELIPELTVAQVEAGIASGMITGGMIPKVENCVEAVRGGVKGATILDGRVEHACLLELFTEGGVGTMISGVTHQIRPTEGKAIMGWFRRGAAITGLVAVLCLGAATAEAEHSDAYFPGIGPVTIRTIKAIGALPGLVLADQQGRVLLNATVGGTQSAYFRISKNSNGTLNPTVHYAVLPGPDVTSRAVLAVAAATGGSDCAYEAIVFGSERGKLSLWTPKTLDTLAEGGIYVGDLGEKRGYGLAVWTFVWGDEPHVAPHRYKVWLYHLNRSRMKFYPTAMLTTRGHYADDTAALRELGLTFPNLIKEIPKLAC